MPDPTNTTSKFKYKLTGPIVMWLVVLAGAIILWALVPTGSLFSSSVVGIVVFVLALVNWLYVSAATIGIHPKAPSSVHNIDQLVTEGTYSVVRHPLYVSDMVLALAVFLLYPHYKVLAVVVWLIIVLLFWANLEERLLEEKFLEDYRQYRKRVPMLIPRFKKGWLVPARRN